MRQEVARTKLLLNLPIESPQISGLAVGTGCKRHLLPTGFSEKFYSVLFGACGFLDGENFSNFDKVCIWELEAGVGLAFATFSAASRRGGKGWWASKFQWKGAVQSSARTRLEVVRREIAKFGEQAAPTMLDSVREIWENCNAGLKQVLDEFNANFPLSNLRSHFVSKIQAEIPVCKFL